MEMIKKKEFTTVLLENVRVIYPKKKKPYVTIVFEHME